jgi:hypothetical protein
LTRLWYHLDHFNPSLSGLPLFGQIDVEQPANDWHFSRTSIPIEGLLKDLPHL